MWWFDATRNNDGADVDVEVAFGVTVQELLQTRARVKRVKIGKNARTVRMKGVGCSTGPRSFC